MYVTVQDGKQSMFMFIFILYKIVVTTQVLAALGTAPDEGGLALHIGAQIHLEIGHQLLFGPPVPLAQLEKGCVEPGTKRQHLKSIQNIILGINFADYYYYFKT